MRVPPRSGQTTTLQTAPGSVSPGEVRAGWSLVVAHHPRADLIGARIRVEPGDRVELGRGADVLGPDGMDDARLSRRHGAVACDEGGALRVHDLDSRNGTFVNGARVGSTGVQEHDVVTIGALVLLVTRDHGDHGDHDELARAAAGDLVGCSAHHAALLDQIRRAAAGTTSVLVRGEPGAGKSAVARAIHAASARGPFVELSCGAIADVAVHAELYGVRAGAFPGADRDREGVVARADGGTLFTDALELATPALQGCLRALLDDGRVHRVGDPAGHPVDVKVIAALGDPAAPVRDDLRHALSGWVVDVPPLRARPHDIPLLARAFLARAGHAGRTFHYRAVALLLRHAWPGNARELAQVVDRAVADAGDEPVIGVVPAIAELRDRAAVPPPAAHGPVDAAALPDDALAVAADARWFRPPGGELVDLFRRQNLVMLLRALVEQRRHRPGEPVAPEALIAAAWPGERLVAKAGMNRLYVAVATLRKLGMARVIDRVPGGYLLRADVPLHTE